jgi:hypothetical protein
MFRDCHLLLPHDALDEHRERLQKVLVTARIARAGLAASLSRVRAAARFTN